MLLWCWDNKEWQGKGQREDSCVNVMRITQLPHAEDPFSISSLDLPPHSSVLKLRSAQGWCHSVHGQLHFPSAISSLPEENIPVKEVWAPETIFREGTGHFGSFIFQNYYGNTQVQKLSWASVYRAPLAGCVFLMISNLFLDWFSLRGSY